MVMLFWLSNALSTFMRLMNEFIKEFIKKFAIVYLDDILICNQSGEEHMRHLKYVLKKITTGEIVIKLKEVLFHYAIAYLLGICHLSRWIEYVPKEIKIYNRVSLSQEYLRGKKISWFGTFL